MQTCVFKIGLIQLAFTLFHMTRIMRELSAKIMNCHIYGKHTSMNWVMLLFWVWIFSSQREGFRSCDKTTDVRLAPLAVSKWMRPKILVSQLVRTCCGSHPSPILPPMLFSGWFVFAVCLAADFKSTWAVHPDPSIQSSSQIPLLIILNQIEMLWMSIFLESAVTSSEGK